MGIRLGLDGLCVGNGIMPRLVTKLMICRLSVKMGNRKAEVYYRPYDLTGCPIIQNLAENEAF